MNGKRHRKPAVQLSAQPAGKDGHSAAPERYVGARRVAIAPAPQRRPRATRRARHGSTSAAILALLEDGKPRRAAALIEALGDQRNIVSVAAYLAQIGAIDCVQYGIYIKAGAIAGEIPKRPTRIGPALLRVYKLLETPRAAVEIQPILGVTRQAVHNALMRLMEAGKVKRLADKRRHYVYAQVGRPWGAALAARTPVLPDTIVRVLSSLPADGAARPTKAIGRGQNFRRAVRRLKALGLVIVSGSSPTRLIRLTKRGRQHPQYEIGAANVPHSA